LQGECHPGAASFLSLHICIIPLIFNDIQTELLVVPVLTDQWAGRALREADTF
jgi:hypothetical protein